MYEISLRLKSGEHFVLRIILGLKAGVEFNKKYQVALSYDFGLIDVQKDLGMKNRNLMISFGYMF